MANSSFLQRYPNLEKIKIKKNYPQMFLLITNS